MADLGASKIPGTYSADYYEANEQDGDRIALRWYASLVDRYAPPGRALDFGCGTGWLVRRLMARRSADGLERSTYALAEASRNNPSARFFVDAADVPSETYAAITCIHVVEHVPEEGLAQLFADWRRVLKPGGVVLVVTPDSGGRAKRIQGDSWRGFDDPTHITLRSHEYWEAALDEAGFDVIAAGSDGLWDPPYTNWVADHVRLLPIALQVVTGTLLERPGSGESAVIVARLR